MLTINADNLPRFMACNGSRLMAATLPPLVDDTSARDEGTAAHYMAAAVFNGHYTLNEMIDRKAPNGVYMTSEMSQHVNEYLALTIGETTFKEMEVETSHDNSPIWVVNGRTDLAMLTTLHVLRVVDFKYGWRIVEPENNWTLINHAIGLCKQSKYTPPSSIELQIFQPRPYHPDGPLRTWKISTAELYALYDQMNAALSNPRDELNTSYHCNLCPALATCPAARKAEMNAIDATDTVFSDTISDAYLSFNLDNLNRASDMIKQRLDAFEELAKHRITAGNIINNYSVKMGMGHSKFKEGIDGPMLKMLTGKDLTDAKLVTPAEAKRRGVPEEILKTLTERPSTGVKLERVNANKKAEKLFSDRKEV